ncbi:MAG: hypothetical protein KAQ79_09760 [Cyclobacteriaceae bacterium]|nr:hypothetical protein [Cyclobacteriaceae bacterium]
MRLQQIIYTTLLILFIGTIFQMCLPQENEKMVVTYINSFHRGHPSSDDIMDGILENFPADSFEIDTYFMDTKRNPSREYIAHRATQLFDSIMEIEPDILLVSDDNAIKYLVQPHLEELAMPVVFCGINWTDAEYDLPPNKVTGMLEILPVADMLFTMRSYYPTMDKLLFLSENTTTSRKEKQLLDTLFSRVGVGVTHELVDDFEDWKIVFKEANQNFDIIYIPTHGAIKGWDHDEAISFISQHINLPVVTTEDFMMPYAVFGLTKVAKEQGIWVAVTAKKILAGSSLTEFPVTRNKQSTYWLNTSLAEKIGFEPDTVLLSKSKMVKN